jgi:hypothetical protein
MSGLNAEKVERLITGLRRAVGDAKKARAFNIADELSDVVRAIEQLQSEKPDQPSRPDRIGDECWYAASKDPYKRGILRAWLGGQYEGHAVAVEDMETNAIRYVDYISFATESPDKMACKPQD